MLVSTENIPRGNEITVNYGYSFASGPLWYKFLMKRSLDENPEIWSSHPTLLKLSESLKKFKWNTTNQYVSLSLSNIRARKR